MESLAPQRVRLPSTIQCVAGVGAVLIFYTYVDSFVYALGGPTPMDWVLVFTAAAAAVVVADLHRPMAPLRSPLTVWLLFFLALTTLWLPLMPPHPDTRHFVDERARSMICLVALSIIFDDDRARRWAAVAIAGCVVLASLLNLAEFTSLVEFTSGPERIPGRASGLYFNPNQSALAIAAGLAVCMAHIPKWTRLPLIVVATLGVAATFSRGAGLVLVLVIACLVWQRTLGTWYVAAGVACGVVLLSYLMAFAASQDLLTENTAARLHFVSGDSGRLELAEKAWGMFMEAPWLGQGLGATRLWDVGQYAHNMYVTLAAEHGIIGLLAFPAFGLALIRSNRAAIPLAAALMAGGFFSHGLLDDRWSLLVAALAAANPIPAPEAERTATAERDLSRAD